jgi:HK97 family phage major capsid protein
MGTFESPQMQLHAIREARAAKVTEARTLLASSPTLTPEAQTAFDKLKAAIVDLEGQEARAEFIEAAERRSLGTPDKPRAALEGRVTLLDAVQAQIEQRAAGGALGEFNAEMQRRGVTPRRGGILVPSSLFNETRATQTTGTHPAILPDSYRPDQFIGLLRNAMVLRSLGATVLSGLSADTVIPRQATAGSAFWVQENAALTESNPTFDSIRLEPKTVGALTSVSRQLLQQANPSIEALLRQDMVQVVGLAIDRAALHGVAANSEPVGIINTAGIQTASLATLSWAALVATFEKLGLENVVANAIVTHAKAATKLQTTLKDATAGSDYLMSGGNVAGLPVSVTSQLDAKPGTPVKGRVLAGDFSQFIVGEFGSAEILANPYAAGFYEKGAVQLRIMASVDMAVRNAKAFVLADDLAI